MMLSDTSAHLAGAGVPHVFVKASKPAVGQALTFHYLYAEPGQNPFTSKVIKLRGKLAFTAGIPKNGFSDILAMLDPIYPLGNNFTFPNLDVLQHAVDEHNRLHDASTVKLTWVDTDKVDDPVTKIISHAGRKVFSLFVKDSGFYQSVTDDGEVRYVNSADLRNRVEQPRVLMKSDLRKVDFSIVFNRETFEKFKHL